jgi:hypothetical protein
MNSGHHILSQVLDLVDRKTLTRLVDRYDAESRVRHFGCRQQLICMAFAQLTWREGLRDIATCLNARPEALYHLGFREPVAKSTLADANEQRDWRLWEDLARGLMRQARLLYAGEDLGLELENTVYALDCLGFASPSRAALRAGDLPAVGSTTIDLSLTLFPWADFRSTKAGIKLHTQIDLRGPIPTCVYITGTRQHDVLWLDELLFEPGAFYVMDRGYMDFKRLNRIASAGAFFVTRAKDNLRFSRQRSLPVDYPAGVRSDQIGKPTLAKARNAFPSLLRKVRNFDADTGRDFVFLRQPSPNPGTGRGQNLPSALAHRVVLPLDQRPPAHPALLRNQPQHREDPNLDCGECLPHGGHPPRAACTARHAAQNLATSERPSL